MRSERAPTVSRIHIAAAWLAYSVGAGLTALAWGQAPAAPQATEAARTGVHGTTNVLPFPDFRFQGSVGRTIADSDPPEFPQPVRPPKGAPNIVYILIDDAGYGQFGTFGGQVETPSLDRVAADGLRYTCFHTTALCSPTRAALLTGAITTRRATA